MTDFLIVNASIINEFARFTADVAIKDGRISQISSDLSHLAAKQTLDADGKILIPGMIDDQVHFREPGFTHKGDIASESAAAVAGGITSYMEMPNTVPLTINSDALEDKYRLAQDRSKANFAFYLGGTNSNLEDIKKLNPQAACGVKVFMGASTGDMLVDNPDTLEGIFANSPTLIATHCEDTPTILANERLFVERYGEGQLTAAQHPAIRSEEACYLSSSLAVNLAKRHGSKLHVLHLTTAKELEHFSAGPVHKKQITVEACVHHLFFDAGSYIDKGNFIKCNPAIKTLTDREALLQAVKNDVIDVIATDHAPHTLAEKEQPYTKAPAGLPLVQYALPSLFEHYHSGLLTLEQIVHKTSHAVTQRFDIVDRGYIREGFWADLTLVDLQCNNTVRREDVLSTCGWSPFEGYTFKSNIDTTWVNGIVAYSHGSVSNQQAGQRLAFKR